MASDPSFQILPEGVQISAGLGLLRALGHCPLPVVALWLFQRLLWFSNCFSNFVINLYMHFKCVLTPCKVIFSCWLC